MTSSKSNFTGRWQGEFAQVSLKPFNMADISVVGEGICTQLGEGSTRDTTTQKLFFVDALDYSVHVLDVETGKVRVTKSNGTKAVKFNLFECTCKLRPPRPQLCSIRNVTESYNGSSFSCIRFSSNLIWAKSVLWQANCSNIQFISFNIQLCIHYSTFRPTFNFYSTFNDTFNIQRYIQHSTFHSTFNFSFNI